MCGRAEAEEKLSELKQRQAEAQRHQSAFWEKRLLLVEQKAQEDEPLGESVRRSQEELRTTSCQLEEASRILSQSEHSFEQKEVELRCSEGRSSKLEADLRLSEERRSQLEAELRCSEGRGSQLEAELQYSEGRSSELEERLHEACSQLEESIHLLEAQEEVKNQLTLERSSLQEERCSLQEELNSLQEESGLRRIREEELHQEASRLKEALDGLHDHGLLREEERQALLLARERSIASLRCDLQEAQETLRTREETQTSLSSELDSLRTDRSGLIQDLKEQATAVDTLRAELDGRRSGQEALQEQLKQERSQGALLKTSLEEEREEAGRLAEEKARYLGLADQLSTQIVEMEEEISSLRHHLGALSVQLNRTADLVLELRGQLRARAGGLTGLQDRLALSQARLQRMERSSARLHKEVERLTSQLEEQGRELSSVRDASARGSVGRLRRELLEEREGLRRAEEASEAEMGRMKQQLLEMEELVVSLEGLAEPGGPRRFVTLGLLVPACVEPLTASSRLRRSPGAQVDAY